MAYFPVANESEAIAQAYYVFPPEGKELTLLMPRARKLHLRVIRYLAAGCGWLLVSYEWLHVSYQTPGRDRITLVIVLIPSLLLIHIGATVWILHNKRLAARGKRGLVTRYTSPAFSQDHLGRRLLMDERSRVGKEIVVSIDGDFKFYTLADERPLGSDEIEISIDRDSKSYTPATEVGG